MLFKSKRKYFNFPRSFNLDFYRFATAKFIERYSRHTDVLSIHLFGGVSVEGISDLDFLVVLKEKLTQPLSKKYSIMTFNEDLRFIYNNTQPFLMNEEIYRNFWKIFPTRDLRLVYGKEIKQDEPEETEARIYNLLILIDVCYNFYPILFLKQLFLKKLDVRYSLLVSNALKFPLQLFMEISGSKYDLWIEFINQVKKFRESWFELETGQRYRILNEILQEASIVSADLMDKLDKYIKQNLWEYSEAVSADTICKLKPLGKYYTASFDKNKAIDNSINEFKQTGKWRAFLPLTFYLPPLMYSFENGVVSKHLSERLSAERDLFTIKDNRVSLYMKDRINLMNKHAAFYKDNGIEINMVHNYYGYNPLITDKKSPLSSIAIRPIFHNLISLLRNKR